jgi:hypothetical protein
MMAGGVITSKRFGDVSAVQFEKVKDHPAFLLYAPMSDLCQKVCLILSGIQVNNIKCLTLSIERSYDRASNIGCFFYA